MHSKQPLTDIKLRAVSCPSLPGKIRNVAVTANQKRITHWNRGKWMAPFKDIAYSSAPAGIICFGIFCGSAHY